MSEKKKPLTDEEIQQVLDRINDKLKTAAMKRDSITGRTITIVNSETTKRSGGIMVSKADDIESDYLGTFYSYEEFIEALTTFLSEKETSMSGTFHKKEKLKIDQDAVDTAIEEFTSLFVEKIERERKEGKRQPNGDFYTVSRKDKGSSEEKTSGGLITPKGMPVKEGQYIDEQTAKQIAREGIVSEPSSPPTIPPESDKEPTNEQEKDEEKKPAPVLVQKTMKSTFKRKKISKELKDKLMRIAKRAVTVLLIPLVALALKGCPIITDNGKIPIIQPQPPEIAQVDENYIPEDDIIVDETQTNEEEPINLEIGDIVEMHDGDRYDHNSQASDDISGEIGANPYREAGDYTVDVIAILDSETNEIIATTQEENANLDDLLLSNGLSREDIESGKIKVRYNVSEGKNADLDRSEAAGWVTYDEDTYQDKGNVIEDMLNENIEKTEEGGLQL